jgi:hypothetical protein
MREAMRSSIKSRSTSQYLSDERRRLCVGSTSELSSLPIVLSSGVSECLAGLWVSCLDFDLLKRRRLGRLARINYTPSRILSYSLLLLTFNNACYTLFRMIRAIRIAFARLDGHGWRMPSGN